MKKLFALLLCALLLATLPACGATKAAYTPPKAEAPAGTVVCEDENCAFSILSTDPDGLYGYTLTARCENKSDETLNFTWENASVDGIAIDPGWALSIAAGKSAKTDVCFYAADLKAAGVGEVGEVTFTLKARTPDGAVLCEHDCTYAPVSGE